MFDTIRDMLAYAYTATETMEKKAHEMKGERERQMEAFREKVKDTKRDMEERGREKMREAVKDSGVATKAEVEELRSMIATLMEKVDKLG